MLQVTCGCYTKMECLSQFHVRSTLVSDIGRGVGGYSAETRGTNRGQDTPGAAKGSRGASQGRESRDHPHGQGPLTKMQFRIIVLL